MRTETGHSNVCSLTSESLLERVRDWDDAASWRQFFATYHRVIFSLASKSGLNAAEAEDVAQNTMIAVADRIRGFQYDRTAGSFKQWISFQARARIKEHWERREREQSVFHTAPDRPDPDRTSTVERCPDAQNDPVLCLDRTWEEALAETALARVKASVAPKHFQMFDLCVMKQWPLRRISRTLGVSAAQVYLIKSRVSFLLKRQTRQVQAQLERRPAPGASRPKPPTQPTL
jgi:RNA polymerase sigma factor (sigma-70 family)